MLQDTFLDKSTLVQVMAWCHSGTKPLPEPMFNHAPAFFQVCWLAKAHTCLKSMFLVGFLNRVCALNLLFINLFHDVVNRIETEVWLKQNMSCCPVNSFDFAQEKLHLLLSVKIVQFFLCEVEWINRTTTQVLLWTQIYITICCHHD